MTGDAAKEDPVREEAFDWLMRVQAAPGDAAVRASLDSWLSESETHRKTYRSVERMWRLAGDLPADYVEQVRGAEQVRALAASSRDRRPRSTGWRRADSRRGRTIAFAAAALAACLALVFLPAIQLHLAADHMTGTAELRTITLEDGSVVHLDAGSAIAVHYGAERRDVALLSGQAFFEVVHGAARPFVVAAGDVAVTVTGTAFGVRASADAVSVAVQSGSVEVALDRGNRLVATLAPGEQLTVDRAAGQVARAAIAPENIAAWRERRLVVDGAPLSEVVEELDRHHWGAIVLRGRTLAARRVTGVFDLAHPVEALQAIVRTQQATMTELTPYLLVISGR